MRKNNLNTILIDEGRAIEICKKIISTLKKRKYLFSNPKTFEHMMPENQLLSAINPNKRKDKREKSSMAFPYSSWR